MPSIGKVYAISINGNIHFGVLSTVTTRELRDDKTEVEYEFSVVSRDENPKTMKVSEPDDFLEMRPYIDARLFMQGCDNYKLASCLADRLDAADEAAREAKRPKVELAPTPSAVADHEETHKEVPF